MKILVIVGVAMVVAALLMSGAQLLLSLGGGLLIGFGSFELAYRSR